MTTINEAREQIYQTFKTDWGTTSALTFDNEKFDPPSKLPWVRLVVRHNVSFQESLGGVGNRKFLRGGSTFVQVFVPLGKDGLSVADPLVRTARNVFEGKTFSPEIIRFTDVVVREIGPDEGWFQVNVEAEFNYDETK